MKLSLKERRAQILELLSMTPISSTIELATETGVSTETIRKDLDALSQEGRIIKVHGGAALANADPGAASFDMRQSLNIDQKIKIAHGAIKFITPGDSIILESCTTCLELSKILLTVPDLLQTLIIITNSFDIANLFEGGKRCNKLFFLGGWSNYNEHSTRGYHTNRFLEDCHTDKAFVSGAALGRDMVLTSYLEEDMLFQRQALKNAKETILLMDQTKFQSSAFFSVGPIANFNYVITDLDSNSALASKLLKNNINLIIV